MDQRDCQHAVERPIPTPILPPLFVAPLQHKASYLTVQCKECRSTQVVSCKPGLGGAMLPRKCETVDPVTGQPCPLNSWVVLGERSKYVDQQTLKLQVRHNLTGRGMRPSEPRTIHQQLSVVAT
jgi:DNA replicative helicase MCM subunit Mcm2 (Cdc46/Mcm family)